MSKLDILRPDKQAGHENLNEGPKYSHLRYFDPVQVGISGVQTYKDTGNLWKSALDPSGDNPFGVMEHKPTDKKQAEMAVKAQADIANMREKAKAKRSSGMKAGGKVKMKAGGAVKKKACGGMVKKSCGGKVKKMAAGGKTCCKGMGAAKRGGNFTRNG